MDAAGPGDDGAEGGVKGDGGAAADGHGGWGAGHHVVIAAAVVGIAMADGAKDGVFVEGFGEFGDHFGEVNAGDGCWDGFELAADFLGGVGFGIEGFEVAGTAVEPDHDAVDGGGGGFSFEARGLGGHGERGSRSTMPSPAKAPTPSLRKSRREPPSQFRFSRRMGFNLHMDDVR